METKREPLKPIQNVSYALIIGLLLLAIIEASAFVSGIWRIFAYLSVGDDFVLGEAKFFADSIYQFIGQVQGFASLPLSILFAVWLYRMNANLRQLSSKPMEFTPGWMIGWYFIPFANLFKPFQGMRELWQVSHKQWDANPSILH